MSGTATLSLMLFLTSVLAQSVPAPAPSPANPNDTGCPIFDRCKLDVQGSWRDGACVQLQATNVTYYAQCLCYYQVELA